MTKVHQFYSLWVLLIFVSAQYSYAQSIYAGGIGDGFNVNSFAQPDNVLFNIYSGGNNDGFSVSSFAQPDNVLFDIYKGGNNDGFAFSSFAQADNVLFDIYKGGTEDGFSMSSFAQPDNVLYDIYKGGVEDGFSFSSFAQPDNVLYDIYKGGISDGFALSGLGGMGTEVLLPIELVSFEGEFKNGKVFLEWRTATELNNERFIIERSINGIEFSALYATDGAGTTSVSQEYFYTDEHPFSGINYYRLKQVDFNQAFTYSKIISVEATDQPGPSITVFPNPSDQNDVIQIMLKSIVKGTPAVVCITTTKGQTIETFAATIDDFNQIIINQSISASISKGVYLISVKLSDRILNVKWVVQ